MPIETLPAQHQKEQPGLEKKMYPRPESQMEHYKPADKLKGRKALITGGDSGIGRAVAIAYAKEGADVAIVYLDEHPDAQKTKELVEKEGRKCLLFAGDIGDAAFCQKVVDETAQAFGQIDILINNAAEQHPQESLEDISVEQLERTFRTNVFSIFYLTKAALPHIPAGGSIINTTSITAYRGHKELIDYSATKGAVLAFTRSLSQQLNEREIRVNAVAPGPIWTPLIPSTFEAEKVAEFGKNTPIGRVGQPDEVAPCYVFLASDDASYMSGQVLHPNGGSVINT